MSWNIEHFKKTRDDQTQQRIDRITTKIREEDPDVFAIYEVEGKDIYETLVSTFPGYSFHITEGPQVQEILVGVRGSITAFFTQKVAFKSGVSVLRPGALLTLRINEVNYPILFLHLKSKNDPRSFGLRDDMISKAIKFKKTLTQDNIPPNYLFIGDLNTMGMNYSFDRGIDVDNELKKSDNYASRYYKMRRLETTYLNTWSNGSGSSIPDSALDHCYAAEHLNFLQFSNKDNRPGTSPVDVRGWADEQSPASRDDWIEKYSDHCYLYLEVHP
jgi:hypothetical protein